MEEWISIKGLTLLPFHGRSTFLRFGCLNILGPISSDDFHSMKTSSNGNIFRVTGPLCVEFIGHRWIPLTKPVTSKFDVFFDLRLNKRLCKQWRRRWFETPSRSLWHHCDAYFQRIKIPFSLISLSVHQNKFYACLDSIPVPCVPCIICKNCSDRYSWHWLNLNQSKTN